MNIDKQLINKIEENESIIICGHLNPDGDSISSSFGLRNFLRLKYPNKKIYSTSTSPKYIKPLVEESDVIDESIIAKSLIIIVDVSDLDRVEDQRLITNNNIICFDHHILSKENNILTLRDTSFISCTLLLSDFILNNYHEIDEKTANYFYIGLVTDSGRFQFNSTSKTFDLASKLVSSGAQPKKIYSQLYKQSSEELRWKSYVYSHFNFEGDVTYLTFSLKDNEKLLFDNEIISGSVNLLSSIDDHHIWAMFLQQEDGLIRVELRSSNRNVQEVALKFNGGGHLLASGCKLDSFDKVKKVLEELNKASIINE